MGPLNYCIPTKRRPANIIRPPTIEAEASGTTRRRHHAPRTAVSDPSLGVHPPAPDTPQPRPRGVRAQLPQPTWSTRESNRRPHRDWGPDQTPQTGTWRQLARLALARILC